jgi:phage tail protein X
VKGDGPRDIRRAPATVVAVSLATSLFAACGDDGGGESSAAPTLPPIGTTGPPTTLAPTTTIVTPYEVRQGDTLSAIATAHSVPVDAVLAANPEIASADDIHEGQIIQVPAPSRVTSTAVDQ